MHLLVGGSPWEVTLYPTFFMLQVLHSAFSLILQKEGPRTTGPVLPQDLEHVRVHIFVPAVRFVYIVLTSAQSSHCKGRGQRKKKRFLSGIARIRRGGLPMPEFFGPLSRSAFLVNKKSSFLQKCQCIELLTVF